MLVAEKEEAEDGGERILTSAGARRTSKRDLPLLHPPAAWLVEGSSHPMKAVPKTSEASNPHHLAGKRHHLLNVGTTS